MLTESHGRKTSTTSGLLSVSFVQPAQTHNTHNDWRIWQIMETPSKAIRSYPSPLHLRGESNMQLKAKKTLDLEISKQNRKKQQSNVRSRSSPAQLEKRSGLPLTSCQGRDYCEICPGEACRGLRTGPPQSVRWPWQHNRRLEELDEAGPRRRKEWHETQCSC